MRRKELISVVDHINKAIFRVFPDFVVKETMSDEEQVYMWMLFYNGRIVGEIILPHHITDLPSICISKEFLNKSRRLAELINGVLDE